MLIQGISGVRGFIKSHFTPDISIHYARAFHEMLPAGVIVAGTGVKAESGFSAAALTFIL